MKKNLFLTLGIGLVTIVNAQKANVVSAYNYMKDQKWEKAFEYIEKATTNEKTALEAKTWFYRSNIISGAIQSQNQEVIAQLGPDPINELARSYKKTLELDDKDNYTKDLNRIIPAAKNLALNTGVNMFNEKKYDEAYELFKASATFSDILDQYDTLAYFNAALAADKSGKPDEAIAMYQKCADVGYNGAQIYGLMAEIHEKQKNEKALLATVAEGRKKYPNNQSLILKELNYYLSNKKYDLAKTNLNAAIENDPKNELLYFALGTVYENLKEDDKALKAYEKAIELKPDYFDAYYNLGAYIFNRGVEYNNEGNELDFRKDKAKIDELEKKSDKAFEEAIPYLEKAHEIDPEDKLTMQTLSNLYVRMGNNEKFKEMKAKMEK